MTYSILVALLIGAGIAVYSQTFRLCRWLRRTELARRQEAVNRLQRAMRETAR